MKLEMYSDIKFCENVLGGSRIVPFGQTNGGTDVRPGVPTDMTKLIVAFRNFANVPKKTRTFCPRCMFFVFISSQTLTLAIYSLKLLVFITGMRSVYSAVRTFLKFRL
jgi:hypothetical protein